MTKIILFGCHGMLGRYLHLYLKTDYEVIPLDRSQYDVLTGNLWDLEQLLTQIGIDNQTLIINCIGLIPQKYVTSTNGGNWGDYIRVNSEFPHLLQAVAQTHGSHFLHITSDCVYDGRRGQYTEDDPPTETGIYGRSKALGEPPSATIIRTSIIGEELHHRKSLLEWVRQQSGQVIKGYDHNHWNGVTCLQLAKIIKTMIQTHNYWIGVRHLCSPHSVTKYQLVKMIAEVYQVPVEITRYTDDHVCDKTLKSNYNDNHHFEIPHLLTQIQEQSWFSLN